MRKLSHKEVRSPAHSHTAAKCQGPEQLSETSVSKPGQALFIPSHHNTKINGPGCFVLQISVWKYDIGCVKYYQKWGMTE